jgi:hypothetical protein
LLFGAQVPLPGSRRDCTSATTPCGKYVPSCKKDSRTPAQQKIDSQLLYAIRRARHGAIAPGLETMAVGVELESDGGVLVDIGAHVTQKLADKIESLGGEVVSSFEQFELFARGCL